MNKPVNRWTAFLLGVLFAMHAPARADTHSFEAMADRSTYEVVSSFVAIDAAQSTGNTLAQSSVPEPDMAIQIAAGLGLFAFIARRRLRAPAVD